MPCTCGAVSKPLAAQTAVTFRVGRIQLTSLLDATDAIPNDGKVFGMSVGPQAVAQVLQHAGAPTGQIALSINVLLARSKNRIMLFDTGLGPLAHGALQQRLVEVGVAPDAVTDVFITHAHPDHVGGLTTQQGRLAFAHARIHISEQEWASVRSLPSDKPLADLILPQVETFKPGADVTPEVRSVDLPGHTPGHAGFELHSQGHRLVDVGDIVHSSIVSLAKPAWALGFDEDKTLGIKTRTSELKRLAQNQELMFAPHFPFPGVGQIETAGDGFAWQPTKP